MSAPARDIAGSSRESDFARTPPQDLVAEQSVLGGMMLSKDAIADVVEVLRGSDFYRPSHESIYEAILDLYGRGEPADAVTVADELTKRTEIGKIGGAAYLHQLIQSVPTAANAGFYAEIVAERAVLRRLVTAGTKIVQMGYAQDGEVEDVVNAAQAEIFAVAERRTTEDYVILKDVMESTVDEIEASGHKGEGMTGVPTGFYEFDELTNGLHPGQMIVIAARPAVGKALALDTVLPTPTGWTTMGEVAVGDAVLAADGTPTVVVAATEVMLDRPCFEVTFDDGSVLIADAEHQWLTDSRSSRKSAQASDHPRITAQVRTTAEIAETLRCGTADNRLNHSIRNAAALDLPAAELPIGPYTFGAWLGDGASAAARVTNMDDEVFMRISAEGYELGRTEALQALLRSNALLGNKHIPDLYLRASIAQRRDLLAGLLDTDGTVTSSGCVQFAVTSRRLADDTRELIHSLGYRTGWSEKRVNGHTELSSNCYTITFATEDVVFGLQRKQLLHKERDARATPKRTQRFITSVRPVESVPVKCIQIAHESHLYLAGRAFIPTHNSTFALDWARSAAITHNMATVVFSLEMGRNELAMRLLSAEATISLQDLRKGTVKDDQWSKIATTMGRMNDAPLFIDDSPNMSLMEIRAKCRRLKQQHDLKLVILDYLQLMSSGKKVESRQQEVSEFSRALKLLAKELQVPVVALSQLNRGSEQRTDKKPMVSDLRESGCLTADTRILRSDTGAETTMGELFTSGAKDVPVWSLGDNLRYVERHLTHVFSTGTKPVVKLTLASGRTVRATANHPFFTYEGWRPLGELAAGDRLGVPRHVNGPSARTEWDDRQVQNHANILAQAEKQSAERWAEPLDGHISDGLIFIPEAVFALPKPQIADFLGALWTRAGEIGTSDSPVIRYVTRSDQVASGLAALLLRFGVHTKVCQAGGVHHVVVDETDDKVRFLRAIQPGTATGLLDALLAGTPEDSHVGDMAAPWTEVGQILAESTGHALGPVTAVLDRAELDVEAVNDLFWDSIVSIVPDGEEEVFDATVVGNHNFIANGIAVHNSIEQDADMVILLHREDIYDKESARAGEADVIVAKHRNGPTKTIVVGFQGHYSRFANMASDSGGGGY